MKSQRTIGYVAVLLLLVWGASCTIKPQNLTQEKDNIIDAYWMLVSVEGQQIEAPNNTRMAYLRLEERDNKINGYTGCNRLLGTYTLDGLSLRLSQLGTTKMACTETETESRFLDVLGRTDNYKVSGDLLTLFDGSKAIATFRTGNPDIIRDDAQGRPTIRIKN